ncbi:hypothetical protein Tco_0165947 [Tanacetum coccineum]
MHGITNPELIKRLHDNIPKSVDEMMRVTTSFLRGEVAASNQARKKTLPAWKQQEVLRRLGSIFTSVYATVQTLKKDSWLELQFSLAANSKLNVVYLLNRS